MSDGPPALADLTAVILAGGLGTRLQSVMPDRQKVVATVGTRSFVTHVLNQLAADQSNTAINIGAGEEHTIRQFAQLICDQVGYDFNRIHFNTDRNGGALSKVLAEDKLRALIPDLQLTPLVDGLSRTTAWFRQEQGRFLPAPA